MGGCIERCIERLRSKSSSESQNWEHIFNATVQILQEQQYKLETMAKERKMLADRIRTEHDKWAFNVSQLQDQISQLEADLVTQEKGGVVEVAKLELLLGLKEREAVLFKFQKDIGYGGEDSGHQPHFIWDFSCEEVPTKSSPKG